MRVLVVADVSAEKVIGGAERMLVNHVRALLEDGHDVTLLTRQLPGEAALQCEIRPGVTEYRLPYSGSRGPAGLWQLRAGARNWWRDHAQEFDAVVAEQPFTVWALLQAGCRLPRLQVVHSFAFEEYATRHGLHWGLRHRAVASAMQWIEARVYDSAAELIVLSHYSRQRLRTYFGLDEKKIHVLPGATQALGVIGAEERLQIRHQLGWMAPTVVTLRNLVPRTGVDMMVQAAAILRHDMPELRWCVMGEGPMLAPLQTLARDLRIDDRVAFTGYLPETEVRRRMQAADAFMLPTRSLEGFGLVTIEANACGLPVVGTPVGAIPEVIATQPYNRLAADISPQALADALLQLLQAPVDYETRAQSLYNHCVRHFSWKNHDARFLSLVRALAG